MDPRIFEGDLPAAVAFLRARRQLYLNGDLALKPAATARAAQRRARRAEAAVASAQAAKAAAVTTAAAPSPAPGHRGRGCVPADDGSVPSVVLLQARGRSTSRSTSRSGSQARGTSRGWAGAVRRSLSFGSSSSSSSSGPSPRGKGPPLSHPMMMMPQGMMPQGIHLGGRPAPRAVPRAMTKARAGVGGLAGSAVY